jgi:hypothetical protein
VNAGSFLLQVRQRDGETVKTAATDAVALAGNSIWDSCTAGDRGRLALATPRGSWAPFTSLQPLNATCGFSDRPLCLYHLSPFGKGPLRRVASAEPLRGVLVVENSGKEGLAAWTIASLLLLVSMSLF